MEWICPSSVAKYFAELGLSDREVKVEVMPTLVKAHQEYGLKVPVLNLKGQDGNDDKEYCSGAELVEYMGMLALSCNTTEEEYLNTYDFCGERKEIGNAKVMHWSGFFTPEQVETLYSFMRQAFEVEKNVPWMGIYVQGFSHSPVSFGMRENYFHTDGENCYTIAMNPNKEYLWYQVVRNNKIPK